MKRYKNLCDETVRDKRSCEVGVQFIIIEDVLYLVNDVESDPNQEKLYRLHTDTAAAMYNNCQTAMVQPVCLLTLSSHTYTTYSFRSK